MRLIRTIVLALAATALLSACATGPRQNPMSYIDAKSIQDEYGLDLSTFLDRGWNLMSMGRKISTDDQVYKMVAKCASRYSGKLHSLTFVSFYVALGDVEPDMSKFALGGRKNQRLNNFEGIKRGTFDPFSSHGLAGVKSVDKAWGKSSRGRDYTEDVVQAFVKFQLNGQWWVLEVTSRENVVISGSDFGSTPTADEVIGNILSSILG